jgi:hypothetical protein
MLILGAILAGFGSYVWTDYIQPKPLYVNIQVFDNSTPANSLKDVAVWLGLKDVEAKHTGDFGLVRFQVPREHRKEQVTPQFQLLGYSLINGRNPDKLNLDRGETNAIFILKTNVQLAAPTTAVSPTVVSPGIPSPTVPSATPAPSTLERKTYTSGSTPSGAGAAFSEWYQLCSDPEPNAWTIAESSFSLTGDRQCNAWSECRQTVNEPTKVCWQFRMQGHSEQTGILRQGNTGIQFSTGVLSVVWKH